MPAQPRRDLPRISPVGEQEIYERPPRFELRELRYFLAVAEHLNFTRAAERLRIAQPALSQHIQALERQLHVKLFVRSRRKVTITGEGEALVIYARQLNNTARVAAEVVQAISRGEAGQLVIGAIFSSIFTILPTILQPFVRKYSGIRLFVQEMTIREQIAALRERKIDLSILRGPISEPDLESTVLFREPFVAAVANGHEFAKKKSVRLEQISRQRLLGITPDANGDFNARIFGTLRDKGLKFDFALEAGDTQTLMGLVAAGVGIALVPASLSKIQPNQISYVPILDKTPLTTIEIVRHRDNVSPATQNFIQMTQALRW